MQRARRQVQPLGDQPGAVQRGRVAGQQLAHALHQQAVAPVLQHGQRQGALQHLAQRCLVACQGQLQIARVEADGGVRRAKRHRAGEQQRVHPGMCGRRERKARLLQRQARVDQPARHAMQVAQYRHQAELAQRAVAAGRVALLQRDLGRGALGGQRERDAVGQQAVVAAPACQRHAQVRRGDGGARQHPVTAPGQAAREPAQGFVVQLAHGALAQRLHLPGGDAGLGIGHFLWRDLCLAQHVGRVHAAQCVGAHDGLDKRHGRDRCAGARQGAEGGLGGQGRGVHGVMRLWQLLQPGWPHLQHLAAYAASRRDGTRTHRRPLDDRTPYLEPGPGPHRYAPD